LAWYPPSLVGHAAFARGFDVFDVLVERAASALVGRGFPGFAALREFGVGEVDLDRVGFGVDRDLVAVLHERDRAAELSFGGHMADDEACRAAGEAAVGDQRDVLGEPGAHDRAGRREHLGHAGPALRAFEADDHHVALLDLLLLHGVEHVFFRVEAVGGAGELEAFFAGDLGHRAVGAEVAAHDTDMARRFERVRQRPDDVLPRGEARKCFQVLGDCFAGDREAIADQEAVLEEQLHHGGRAAHLVQIFLHILAAGPEVGKIRHAIARRLEVVDRELHADALSHRNEMHHGVGRAANRHHDGHRVLEGLAGHHIPRLDVLFKAVFDDRARLVAFLDLVGVGRGDRRTVGERHAEGFDRRGHRVGGVHAAARARAGAGVTDDFAALGVGHLAGELRAVTREGGDDVDRFAGGSVAGADRAAVDHEAGAVQPAEGHDRAGHVLVAPGQDNAAIVPLGAAERFDRVGDDVARLERVAHTVGAHRDAVGNADGVELPTNEPGRDDALLHFAGEVQEVHVAGVPLEPHAGDADLGLRHVAFGEAGGVEHRLRGALLLGLGDVAAEFVEGLVFGWLGHLETPWVTLGMSIFG